ncbi:MULTISPECIES: c-type cytochrome biogenesis protein CcmI [Stutzerimonas]|jgi:cytochrome c-type biogenesis protein CcmH|uniref:Cytochrome c-type biogenesis protein n=1 Tax=Stutzerimonas stutzeri (strain A1501) TaxID=379731 RepID=A4VMJ6_STUS1|nr:MULTISPECIES: c-type cytochrome biogenesis protein CcmI [Stutzerimonas]ABP80197.1 cytochrome c-type biogenesis protein [Stutzerimonas stutzeri A1501]AVX13607.1 c-type cytochrome biogenesis protein CcmI [Stutzerimonas stutzeri]MBH3355886.1 c-type cytochrome biogenesis protein CcmI [Stutzerimonas stutzeri]MBS9726011.1 c-type cytochrome biogenesis protein CcmI [Stutzerimonas stutzeri]MDL2173945.1 c-type cytochrome biogenesis protein CcmI [Stutzerimonas sp. FeSN7]
MTDFWIAASALLLVALAFLLLPILRGRRAQAEEDRTALNVALYEERLAELTAQHAAGTLSDAQLEAGRADAARELLEDTENSDSPKIAKLGRSVPLIAAVLVPLVGYGLYMHWGASDKVQMARQFSEQPRTVEEMTAHLEQAVKEQPDSAEAWYFLGRTYMNQERPADAAKAFARVVELAGRQPELLGQWAQAQYFAGDRQWSEQLQALTDEALQADPQELTSLGLLGIAAYEEGRYQDAVRFWEQLVAALPENDPSREAIRGGIERARQQVDGGSGNAAAGEAPAAASTQAAALQIQVQLDPKVAETVSPEDSVFVFARAVNGPPVPLAAKRLTVGDLPATVTLSDADAMVPSLKISSVEQVTVMARVSRTGDATKGEWMGQSEALETRGDKNAVRLTIDRAEAP